MRLLWKSVARSRVPAAGLAMVSPLYTAPAVDRSAAMNACVEGVGGEPTVGFQAEIVPSSVAQMNGAALRPIACRA